MAETFAGLSLAAARARSASDLSKKRGVACSATISLPSSSRSKLKTQNGSGLKAFISRSRSTRIFRVGVCTRPAESFANRLFASSTAALIAFEIFMPQYQSSTWRATPASMSSKSRRDVICS